MVPRIITITMYRVKMLIKVNRPKKVSKYNNANVVKTRQLCICFGYELHK